MERYFVVNTIETKRCKDCGGSQICEHNRRRTSAKNAEVVRFVNTIEYEVNAKNAEVVRFVNTIETKATAKNAEVFYL